MMVDTTSAAMSMLSKGKQQIDVMILNVHSSNTLSFYLLTQAVALDIISLAVCDEHNEFVAKNALEEGAYLCLNKPFDKKIVKYLWQFVLRETIQREKARKRSEKYNIGGKNKEQSREKKNVYTTEVENDFILNGEYKLRRKRGKKSMKEINEGESQSNSSRQIRENKVVKQKGYIEWTDDLHAKFMKAIHQLGEGKCYPKEILEMMNVPGLTRMQVASHLQKCRRNNWRSPNERKSIRYPSGPGSSSDSHEPRSSFRKFGTMPCLQMNAPNLQCSPYQTQRGPEFNKILCRGESSIQQLYRPQLQVQPYYFSICNPFNNLFSSAQTHPQQHASLFGMLGSQGPIIGNTNTRPGLALNSLSGYSLDLNVAQGATYCGSGLMSGIGTINDNDQVYSDDQEAGIPNHSDEPSNAIETIN